MTRRTAFAVAAYAFTVNMAGTTLPTPLYPLYTHAYGYSPAAITVIFATYAIGVLLALVLVGRLSDELGRRPVLLAGLGLSAVSAAVFVAGGTLPLLLVGRLLSGLSAGIFTGTATAALADLAPEGRRMLATVTAAATNLGGLGLGTLLAGVLADVAPEPLRLPYVIDIALVVPGILLMLRMREPAANARGRFRPRPLHFRLPRDVRGVFAQAATAGFVGFAVSGLFGAVVPIFLAELLHETSHALSGGTVTLLFAASTLGQVAVVRMAPRRSLPVATALLIAGALLVAASIETRSLALLLLAAAVSGLGQGQCIGSGIQALHAATPPERRGEVDSTYFVVLYIALALPIIGVGIAVQAVGLRTAGTAFCVAAAVLGVVALTSLVLRPPAEERHEPQRLDSAS